MVRLLLCLVVVIAFGYLTLIVICCQIILPGTTRTKIVSGGLEFIFVDVGIASTARTFFQELLLCLVLTYAMPDQSSQSHPHDIGDRCVLPSSVPWKMVFTMVEQIVPFYLLILWIAVLLSKSMVESVRLCARVRT